MKKYKNELGQLHRTDGPAIEHSDGTKEWFINGLRHREDGPACEDSSGYRVWWVNGKCHREDGPAVEFDSGYKEWWLNGLNYYSEERYNEDIIEMKLKRLTEL